MINGGEAQWLYIGNYICPINAATKSNLKIEFVGHSYYNDVDVIDNQDSMLIFRFKTLVCIKLWLNAYTSDFIYIWTDQ